MLVLADALLVMGNVLHLPVNEPHEPTGAFSSTAWSGDVDGSYMEQAGYAQLLTAVVILAMRGWSLRSGVLGVWALVLTIVVADDAFQLHERVGALAARGLGLPAVSGLRAVDLGELMFWAVSGTILGAVLLVAHLRARGAERRHSWTLALLLVALSAFAVVIDMVHGVVSSRGTEQLQIAMALLENAGELGVMTAILLAVVVSYRRQAKRSTSASQRVA